MIYNNSNNNSNIPSCWVLTYTLHSVTTWNICAVILAKFSARCMWLTIPLLAINFEDTLITMTFFSTLLLVAIPWAMLSLNIAPP